jgi:hypothetical protein
MSRQVILATKVLPPFEVIDFPKSITVKVKVADGELNVSIPVQLFNDEKEYLEYVQENTVAIKNSLVLAKAEKVELVEVKDPTEEQDEVSDKLQWKTIAEHDCE